MYTALPTQEAALRKHASAGLWRGGTISWKVSGINVWCHSLPLQEILYLCQPLSWHAIIFSGRGLTTLKKCHKLLLINTPHPIPVGSVLHHVTLAHWECSMNGIMQFITPGDRSAKHKALEIYPSLPQQFSPFYFRVAPHCKRMLIIRGPVGSV